jgi:hypothetical protein
MFPHRWSSSGVKDVGVNASGCFISGHGFASQFSLGNEFSGYY